MIAGLNFSAALVFAAVSFIYYVFLDPIIALGTAVRHFRAVLLRHGSLARRNSIVLERVRAPFRRRLDPAARRPCFRGPQAGARRHLFQIFIAADLSRRGSGRLR